MSDIAFEPLEAALARPGDGPKWQRLAGGLRSAVIRGVYRPDDRIPPETELSRALAVSVGTVQKALRALTEEGLIVRRRRTGTFIANRRDQVDRVYVYRFRDAHTGELLMPFVRTLEIGLDDSPGPWREALGRDLVRIDRLAWVDRDPPAFNSLFLNREHGEALLGKRVEELHGSSCHRVLTEQFNIPTLRMEHSIACGPLSERAAKALHLAPMSVGLIWNVKDFSIEERPVLFQRFELPQGHRPMEISETVEPASG